MVAAKRAVLILAALLPLGLLLLSAALGSATAPARTILEQDLHVELVGSYAGDFNTRRLEDLCNLAQC
jgi:hypothetical protein